MTALDELYLHIKKYYDGKNRADDKKDIRLCARVVAEEWNIAYSAVKGDTLVFHEWFDDLLEEATNANNGN